jgi:hypothetical protein
LDNKLITDGTKSWRAWPLVRDDGVASTTTGAALTPPRHFIGSCAATRHVRVRVGVAGTGSPVITINGSSGVGPASTGGPSGTTTGVPSWTRRHPPTAQVGASDTNAIGNGLTVLPAVSRRYAGSERRAERGAARRSVTPAALFVQSAQEVASGNPITNGVNHNGGSASSNAACGMPARLATTPTALTATSSQLLQMSTRGNLYAEGQIANNTAAAGNPFVTGALSTADAAAPTAVTAGNTGWVRMSTEGRQFVQTDHPNRFKCILAMTTATTTQCQAAPGSNSLYVTDIILGESGTAATQTVTLVQGTGANCGTGTADHLPCRSGLRPCSRPRAGAAPDAHQADGGQCRLRHHVGRRQRHQH